MRAASISFMLYDTLMAEPRDEDGLGGVRTAALQRARRLLDLLDRRREETSSKRRPAYGTYEERAERVGAEIRHWFEGCAGEEARAVALCLVAAADTDDLGYWLYGSEAEKLVLRGGRWTRDEVAVLLLETRRFERRGVLFAQTLAMALSAAETLEETARRELAPTLRRVNRAFSRADVPIGWRAPVTERMWAIQEGADPSHVPDGVLPVREPWAAALRDLAKARPTIELARFVRHLASLSAPRPAQKWRRTCVSLADQASAGGAVAECLRALAEDEPLCSEKDGAHADWVDGGYHYHYLVHQNHGDVARGVLWAAALTGGPEATPRLAGLAVRAGAPGRDREPDLRLAGAAINALGAIDDPGALESLWRARAKIRNRALRKQLDTAIEAAAGRQGITPEQLVERSVPSHGLGPDGALERRLGGHTARVAVEDAATVRLTFTGADGRTSRTAPAAVKDGFPDELKELKALAKEVRATLSAERARIEGLMSDDRAWPFDEWRTYYRDHPITGVAVRGLIWEFQDEDGAWHAAMAPGGDPVQVRLWHPIRAAVDEVRSWRERIAGERVRQPFKQAFREIYLLTPAEEETETYSNRFAAHIVRYRRLYALFKERGWQANFLGRYDGGFNGEARGEFGGGRWRACFYHEPADEAEYSPEYASTDQVRFECRAGRRWREARLAEVPPVVFSEAMRDVDLFVGVTSIAADPEWADRGEDRHLAYWRATAFGELTATAEVRRAALERILPRTKIAARCSIDGRYLVVRGELRTYKIHLGSANILMEPDDSYLCIVQARGRGQGTLYLPFEDERLSLVLSKAFLLAADHKITDPAILRQISPATT